MRIGELATRTGLSISAIRYYQRRGLVPSRQVGSGWQRFGDEAVVRLIIITLAKDCGFSLDEISVLLDALYAPASPAATWQAIGEAKLAELDSQIARLQQMRSLLTSALDQCHLDPDRRQIIATALDWAGASSQRAQPARTRTAGAPGVREK